MNKNGSSISKNYINGGNSTLCDLVSPAVNTFISSNDFVEKNCTTLNAQKLENNYQVIHTSTQSGTSSSIHGHMITTAVITSTASISNNTNNTNIYNGNSLSSSPNMTDHTILLNSARSSRESVKVV